jgi:quercetin dioxygenase-like cupin family protein
MPQIIKQPTRVQAHGDQPKVIEEFIGRANSQTTAVSIARMVSPAGWNEPGQRPDFDEFTVVLRGQLNVETREGTDQLTAGQAVIVWRGERVRNVERHFPAISSRARRPDRLAKGFFGIRLTWDYRENYE